MTAQYLPPYRAADAYAHAYTVALDGVTYTYRLRWDDLCSAWYLDFGEALRGVRVCCGALFGARMRSPGMPRGYLACEDLSGAEEDPTRLSLGARHVLVWVAP